MAATVMEVIKGALVTLNACDLRAQPEPDDAAYCLGKLQDVVLSLPHFNVWKEVEIIADYDAGSNERIAIIGPVSVTITLPTLVRADKATLASLDGFILATGNYNAAPRDGDRVLVYAQETTENSLYAYRADTGKWLTVINLEYDSPLPINRDLHGYLEAALAVEIEGAYGTSVTETVAKRYREGQRAFAARFMRVGSAKMEAGLQPRNWC